MSAPLINALAQGLPDTGWRRINDHIQTGQGVPRTVTGNLDIRRIGNTVKLRVQRVKLQDLAEIPQVNVMIVLPPGFQAWGQTVWVATWDNTTLSVLDCEGSRLRSASAPLSPWLRPLSGIGDYWTDDPFPPESEWPGVAVA